jgi:hypothetical protein
MTQVNFDPGEDMHHLRREGVTSYIQDMHKGMRSGGDARLLFANIADDPRLAINGAGSGGKK